MKTVTKLEARTEEMTFRGVPYDVEIKGRKIGGLVVNKLPKLIEIVVPAPTGELALPLAALDYIARSVSPSARIQSRSKTGTARRMLYSI